jgi:hypothetical protein
VETIKDGDVVTAQAASPFSQMKRFPCVRQLVGVAFVLGLLAARSPAAVAGKVTFSVVPAFDRVSWGRSSTHVRNERDERSLPPYAHVNPATAVTLEVLCELVRAPCFDSHPDHILGRAATFSGLPVRSSDLAIAIAAETPAALGILTPEIASVGRDDRAARTPTNPVTAAGVAFHGQTIESFTGQVDKVRGDHGGFLS